MPDLLIPDISEFQNVDWSKFAGPIIVRAHNGSRADYKWSQNSAGASRQPWWGVYQYLPANVDAAGAAQALLRTVGNYKPNVTILDLEEGSGDQSGRQHAWLSVMAGDPTTDWTYSGYYFARDHGVSIEWVASYGSREPTTAHTLWQFSDAHSFPGIGACDASVFHGSIEDLQRLTSNGPDAPPKKPVQQQEDDVLFLIKGDATNAWLLTDCVTPSKTNVVSVDTANRLIFAAAAAGRPIAHDADNKPLVVPQAFVDGIGKS